MLILSVFPGIDLPGRAFEEAGCCGSSFQPLLKTTVDCRPGAAKSLGNSIHAQSIRMKLSNVFSRNIRPMGSPTNQLSSLFFDGRWGNLPPLFVGRQVKRPIYNFQILYAVVVFQSVFVMHVFGILQCTAKMLLHQMSMLKNPTPIEIDFNVSALCVLTATTSVEMVVRSKAFLRTKLHASFFEPTPHCLSGYTKVIGYFLNGRASFVPRDCVRQLGIGESHALIIRP